ncbi:hypothetical protein FQA39_LY18021 [Lamprigera yunnana]|nr:hypothetical protein FQA39_LY18021 [Lamprigera yunnana]
MPVEETTGTCPGKLPSIGVKKEYFGMFVLYEFIQELMVGKEPGVCLVSASALWKINEDFLDSCNDWEVWVGVIAVQIVKMGVDVGLEF